jgi:hypothetical protein
MPSYYKRGRDDSEYVIEQTKKRARAFLDEQYRLMSGWLHQARIDETKAKEHLKDVEDRLPKLVRQHAQDVERAEAYHQSQVTYVERLSEQLKQLRQQIVEPIDVIDIMT